MNLIELAIYNALVVDGDSVADLSLRALDYLISKDLVVPDKFILNPAGEAFLASLKP